jgi:hypothetical protein
VSLPAGARTHARSRAPKGSTAKRSQLLSLSPIIQERDLQICLALHEHKILTTHQLNDLFFPSYARTRARLLRLYRAGILDRFTPFVERGSAPNHYILGDVGAHLVAGELGIEAKDIIRGLNRLAARVRSQRLQHLVEVNGFFTRLAWACIRTPDHKLSDWWSEEKTRRSWGFIVNPDGFGRLERADLIRSFFLELDRGSESPSRLAHKLLGYEEAARARDRPDLLLFCLPSPTREVAARKVLRACGIAIASTSLDRHMSDPLGPIWLPITNGRRLPLMEVPIDSSN